LKTILDLIVEEPAATYHAKAAMYLSSHHLAHFRKSPLLYHKVKAGLVPDEDRPAYLVGRAAHTLILEGRERYAAEYAVGGPINPATGKRFGANTKAFAEWQAAQGKPVLTDDQALLVESMADGVVAHDIAMSLLAKGVAEGVVRAEYCGLACQIRMDWFNPDRGLVDFKTCDDLTYFEADARRYGYAHQLAFYRAVLVRATGALVRSAPFPATYAPVHIIAVEKKEPYRCGVWRVSDETLAVAQKENEAAIVRLRECEQRGTWPSGYEEIRTFDL
jgi:hypothetical protein